MKQDNEDYFRMTLVGGLFLTIILIGAMCTYTTTLEGVLSNSTAITLQDRSLQSEDLKTITFSITDESFDCKVLPDVCLEAYKQFNQRKPAEAQVTIAPIKITVDNKETSTTVPVTVNKVSTVNEYVDSSLERDRVDVCSRYRDASFNNRTNDEAGALQHRWICVAKTSDLLKEGHPSGEIIDAISELKFHITN